MVTIVKLEEPRLIEAIASFPVNMVLVSTKLVFVILDIMEDCAIIVSLSITYEYLSYS